MVYLATLIWHLLLLRFAAPVKTLMFTEQCTSVGVTDSDPESVWYCSSQQ